MSATHIAQLNVGRFLYPTGDSRMAGFMDTSIASTRSPSAAKASSGG